MKIGNLPEKKKEVFCFLTEFADEMWRNAQQQQQQQQQQEQEQQQIKAPRRQLYFVWWIINFSFSLVRYISLLI